MASSIISGYKSTGLGYHIKRSSQDLAWNPISNLAVVSKLSKNEMIGFGSSNMKTRVLRDHNKVNKGNSFVVYANSIPAVSVPSAPSGPPSNNIRGFILGIVVSIVLPFLTNKWGPLLVLKNRIDNAVQTVEDFVEAVEKVAENVDKIAEDIADDLPEGKLKEMVESVEHIAEKAAKTADSVDNIIDKVQEAEEDIVDSLAADIKPKDT